MSDTNPSRIALVTGANKGIGLEVARQLAAQGIDTIVAARDAQRGAEAARSIAAQGGSARALVLDVTDTASIAAAAADVTAREGRLDILINNAGIGLQAIAPSQLDMATLRATLETNFFGVIAVAQAFLPLLRQSPAGRIVNVASSLGSLGRLSDPEWVGYNGQFSGYSLSKTAVNGFTALLSAEVNGTSLKVNSVEPGFTQTDMTGGKGFQTAAEGAKAIIKYALIGADGPNGGFFDIHGRMPW